MNNLATLYIRVSTIDQEVSPEMQEHKIKQYCKLHNLELNEVIVEKNVSGKIPLFERPGGKKVKGMKSSHLVVMKMDRCFRNLIDCLTTCDYFVTKKISFHVVDLSGMSIDLTSPMGRMMITMVGAFAQWERETIAQRTRDALQSMKRQGKRVGGIPVGHTVNKVQNGVDERGLPKYEKFIVPDPDFDITKKIIMENKDKPLRYIKTLLPHSMALGMINSLRAGM